MSSQETPEPAGRKNTNLLEFSTFCLDSDFIFGFTSHLLRRKPKVVDGSPGRELQPPPPPGPLESGLRKRVQAAEGVDCGSRPPPEGAGATTGLEKEERGTWCKNCQVKLAELRRQALKLVIPGSIKDPGFSAFIFDKLQVPDSSKSSRNESESRCEVCATHLNQLKKEAIQMVHTLSQASTQDQSDSLSDLAVGSASPKRDIQNMVTLSSQRDWPLIAGQASRQPGKSGNIISGTERRKGVGWPQGTGNLSKSSIQVTVGPSGLSSALSSVTIQAQQYLEGMWNISRVNNFLPNAYLTQTMTEGGKEGSSQEPLTPQNSVSQAWAASTPAAQNSLLPGGIPSGASAAASFFIRAAQKLNLSSKRKKHHPGLQHSHEFSSYTTDFSGILQVSPPPAPPCLLRAVSKVKDNPGIGKVKVMVRICPSQGASDTSESMSFLKVDSRKKQITLYDPSVSGHISSAHRRTIVAAPKMFAFDAVFTQDASQAEVCSGTVAEVIQSVVNGADGCIFCFGHVKLGKSYTMIGKDNSTQNLGIIPCAISWLFKLINERKEKTGTRFSVRVSAVEIWGKEENLRDLLSEAATGSLQDGQSPGVYLREDPICGTQLQNQSELRAPTAEKAAYFLDAAIASRRTSRPDCDEEERRNSHMLFTLHIYQYRMEKSGKGGMSGGRSRLHLIDLGSCEKVLSKSRDGSGSGGLCLSLSALGNVILALVNGAKHIPYKDSKLTMLLRESLGNINCRTTMITHISGSPANYTETLTSIQLAARIHRMRKKKSKYASSSSGGESSCEEGRIRRPPHLRPFHPRTIALDPELPALGISSDPDYSSSSEQSCDTVIYVGPDGAVLSDRDLTDNEGPPEFVPIIPSLNKRYDVKRNRETATGGKSTEKDYFKCNTFAELQERLECIDGSEAPLKFCAEQGLFLCSTSPISLQGWMENGQPTTVQDKPQSVTGQENGSPRTSAKHPLKEAISPKKRQGAHSQIPEEQGSVSPAMIPPQSKTTEHLSLHTKAEGSKVELSSDAGTDGIQKTITASSNVPRSDCPKAHEQTAGAPASVVREKSLFYRRPLPSPAPPPPQTKDTAKICSEFNTRCVVRTPPVGMSHQMSSKQECGATGGAVARCRGTHSQSGARDVNHLRSALRTGCIDRDMLTTTLTLQQPVELNGEDELVFTMVEELSFGEVLESGRPASIISFNSDCSLQALASGSRPVSIISSINDDFEAYTSPAAHAGVNIDIVVPLAEAAFCSSSRRSSISSWLSEVSICTLESECAQSSDSLVAQSCCSCGETSLGPFNLDSPDELQDMTVSLPHTPKSTLNDSGFCFSELENESAGSSKLVVDGHKSSDALGSPKAASSKSLADATNSSVMKSGTPAHSPGPGICEEVPISHCSLPTTRKVKPTSSVSHSCSTVNCADAQRQENKLSDPWLRRTNSQLEPKAGDQALSAKSSPRSGNSIQAKQQMKTSQNNGTLPRLNRSYTTISCTHRVVDGCEMATKPNGTNGANVRKCEGPGRAAQVKKGSAAVATMPIMHTSANVGAIPKSQQDYASITGSLKSTAGKKTSAPKASMLPRLSGTPPAPPVRKSSLDLKNRAAPLVGVQKSTASDTINATSPKLEDEIDGRPKAAPCVGEGSTNKPANGKPDQAAAKNASNPKSKLPKLEAVHRCGSQASLERCDSLSSVVSKNGVVKESGNLGNNNGRTGRSVPRLGVSPSVPAVSSPPIPMVLGPAKSNQTKCASNNKAVVSAGKCRSLSTSGAKVLTTSVKSLTQSIGRSSSVPPNGKTIPRSAQPANCKPGKGTIMGTKQAVRAANSRVSELASGASSSKMGHLRGSTDSDSGNDSGVNLGDEKSQIPILPSPYSKITAPRRPQRYSSGHGSDNSSVLSGELPPAMGRTALFYHSGGSSGYESMIRDSEATGSASSAHDSMSESGLSSSGRNRSSKSPKKRTTGIQRRRLIPAPLPDASSLGRKPTTGAGQWVDLPPLPGTLKESFEIKVYEIDDVERLQRHRQEENEQPFEDVDKGLLYFNTKLKILEKRQQRIRELKAKHEVLKKELEDTKDRLMMDPDKWNSEFEVDPDLNKDSLEYLEALEEVTEELEQRVNLCKSRIMMVTCFDIGVIIDVHDGPREVQV